jgi:predicted NBD/HSP70 family sugar kinase
VGWDQHGAKAARLAHAVAALTAMIDRELVVLSGGIGRNTDRLLGLGLRRTALRQLTPLRPRVVAPTLGDDAVLLGAVATAAESARDHVFDTRES